MKRLLLLLLATAAFAFTAVAQDASPTSSASGQTSTTTTKKKSSKAGDEHAGMAMDHQDMSGGKGKGSTLTGCISASPNSDGMYTLSNAKRKKGVEVGPADKVKDHAGHQVSLTGKWSTAAEAGEANAASSKEKGERHFEVDSVKHISETCSEAAGGGTTGTKGAKKGAMKGDKKSSSSTPPPQL